MKTRQDMKDSYSWPQTRGFWQGLVHETWRRPWKQWPQSPTQVCPQFSTVLHGSLQYAQISSPSATYKYKIKTGVRIFTEIKSIGSEKDSTQ